FFEKCLDFCHREGSIIEAPAQEALLLALQETEELANEVLECRGAHTNFTRNIFQRSASTMNFRTSGWSSVLGSAVPAAASTRNRPITVPTPIAFRPLWTAFTSEALAFASAGLPGGVPVCELTATRAVRIPSAPGRCAAWTALAN